MKNVRLYCWSTASGCHLCEMLLVSNSTWNLCCFEKVDCCRHGGREPLEYVSWQNGCHLIKISWIGSGPIPHGRRADKLSVAFTALLLLSSQHIPPASLCLLSILPERRATFMKGRGNFLVERLQQHVQVRGAEVREFPSRCWKRVSVGIMVYSEHFLGAVRTMNPCCTQGVMCLMLVHLQQLSGPWGWGLVSTDLRLATQPAYVWYVAPALAGSDVAHPASFAALAVSYPAPVPTLSMYTAHQQFRYCSVLSLVLEVVGGDFILRDGRAQGVVFHGCDDVFGGTAMTKQQIRQKLYKVSS